MGALEEAHLATVAACVCDNDEEEDLLVELGGGKAPGDTMELTVRALLVGIGDDDRREGLRRTPKSVTKAFPDGTRGITRGLRMLTFIPCFDHLMEASKSSTPRSLAHFECFLCQRTCKELRLRHERLHCLS